MTDIPKLVETLSKQLLNHQLMLATAESCTGGGLSQELTALSGSSEWFERGFITYSNHAKEEVLGVTRAMLEDEGAVSEAVVCAMADGAILESEAHLSVAISGVAGPAGGSKTKPVGTVWIGFAGARQPTSAQCFHFTGDRETVREQAIIEALKGLIKRLKAYAPPPANAPRYFIALWPDVSTAEKLEQKAKLFTDNTACRVSGREDLHVTLAYLHTLSTNEIERVFPDNCPVSPFELTLKEAKFWPKNQLAHFRPEHSKALSKLQRFINKYLVTNGFKPERRNFEPHITFARDYPHAFEVTKIDPVRWFVHELCLVESKPDGNKSHYNVIKRTQLHLKTC